MTKYKSRILAISLYLILVCIWLAVKKFLALVSYNYCVENKTQNFTHKNFPQKIRCLCKVSVEIYCSWVINVWGCGNIQNKTVNTWNNQTVHTFVKCPSVQRNLLMWARTHTIHYCFGFETVYGIDFWMWNW